MEADQRQRIGAVRQRLASEGPRWTRTKDDFATVTLPWRDCELVRDVLVREQAEVVVEIGLAYGSSALAIGEALAGAPRPRQVIIDPFQTSAFADVGIGLLHTAGLDDIVHLIRQPSSVALPQLIADGLTADAAFVDGSHRFHEVVVDLYFLRKIVRPGGAVIMDDYWWPSVHAAARYFETNLGWRVIENAFDGGTVDPRSGESRVRMLRLPDPTFEPAFEDFRPFLGGFG
jgi:predicted O-methyltransferase YrrM